MDFTSELISFQGALMAADNKHSFSRLTSRGGNESSMEEIIQVLLKFFQERQYSTDEGIAEKCKSELRKLCFYVVLNADFRALDQIVELPDLGHLVWTTPTITTCLFSEIICALRMEPYVAEVIAYSCPKLSVEILKSLLNGLRYCSAQESIGKLRPLTEASYECLCRLSLFDYDNVLTTSLISELYTHFLRCITHFVSPPNFGKLEQLPDEDRYVHLGRSLHSLARSTITCLDIFQSPLHYDSDQFDMYLSTVCPESVKIKCLPKSVKENSDPAVLEYLVKCNNAMLDKCVELVMQVSVDTFCTWSEHEQGGRSLQTCVGEVCYHLHQQLRLDPQLSKHTLASMLPQLCVKPADIFDIIQEADDDSLITNAHSNTPDREHWLNAIIERSNLYESQNLFNCLIKHMQYLNPDACLSLFNKSISHLQQNNYQNEMAKSLAVKSFAGVESGMKLDLLSFVFQNGILHDYLMEPDFDDTINETFNKLISTTEYSMSEICDIFLQNPCEVYEKMLNVGVENLKQANLMLNAIAMLKPFSQHRSDGDKQPALLSAVDELCSIPLETEMQENSFVELLSGLCGEFSELRGPLLVHILMPYIYKCVVNKELRALQLHLRVVRRGYAAEQLVEYRAPLLAVLGQVLAAARWDFTSYTAEAPATLQETIDLQTSLFKSYQAQIPDKDVCWLKSKLKKLKALNMYYFKEIWNPPGNNFIQVITNNEKINDEQYPILLAKIINSCTLREWSEVWRSLVQEKCEDEALELLHNTLAVMTLAESTHRSDNSRACLRYCYRCFTCLVKEHYISDLADESKVTQVLETFVGLANITSEEDIEDIGAILLPLLASVTSKKRPPDDTTHLEIVNKLQNGKFAELVKSVFANAAL